MKPEILLAIALGGGSLIIVVINDWWKRRLVEKVQRQHKSVRADLLDNKTQWGAVLVSVIVLALSVYLMSNPDLANRDFGPLTPFVQWFFAKPD